MTNSYKESNFDVEISEQAYFPRLFGLVFIIIIGNLATSKAPRLASSVALLAATTGTLINTFKLTIINIIIIATY